jgi:hypothetical protein
MDELPDALAAVRDEASFALFVRAVRGKWRSLNADRPMARWLEDRTLDAWVVSQMKMAKDALPRDGTNKWKRAADTIYAHYVHDFDEHPHHHGLATTPSRF